MKKMYMAKTTMAAAGMLLALAAGGWAQGDPVYSVNVFGFQTVAAPSNSRTIVATPYQATGDDTIQEVVGGQLTAGDSYGNADHVITWDRESGQYKRFYLLSYPLDPYWDNKWIDTSTNPNIMATASLPPGMGFWIDNTKGGDDTVVLRGEVVDVPVITNVIAEGLQLVSYPYSTDMAIDLMQLTNGLAGSSYGDADHIITWDKATQNYKRFYLYADPDYPEYNRRWVDTSENAWATNDIITAGEGFWYDRKDASSFEWVVTRPYDL